MSTITEILLSDNPAGSVADLNANFDNLNTDKVEGPASATNNAIVRYDGITGKLIQDSTVTIGDTGGIATTIADTSNVVGLTVTQNDVTNNPRGQTIINEGTGIGLFIDQNGNGKALEIDSESTTAAMISAQGTQTAVNNGAISLVTTGAYTGGDSTSFINAVFSNSSSTGTIMNVDNAGTGRAIFVDQNNNGDAVAIDKDVTNANHTTESLQIDHTSVVTDAGTYTKTGAALQINSNVTETSGTITDSAQVLDINQTYAGATGNVVDISSNASGRTMFINYDYDSGTAQQALYIDDENSTGGNQTVRIDSRRGAGVEGVLLTQDGNASGMRIDQNSYGIGLDIDQDANSASNAIGLRINSVNAGAGTSLPAQLTNSEDVASAQALILEGDRATPTTGDNVYQSFYLSDSAGNQDEFARIKAQALDVTSTSEDGELYFGVVVAGSLTDKVKLDGTNLRPNVNDGTALGQGTNSWSDLFLAEGGVINWDNGDVTMTQTGNVLAVSGGDLQVATAGVGTNADSVPTLTSTNTFTNKRITKRTGTTTSSATPTINTDNVDAYHLTAQTADITSFTTNLSGTPTDFQTLAISVTGTAARAITWGASFENGPVALPTTTVTTTRLDVLFMWNAVTSKWRCMATGSTV